MFDFSRFWDKGFRVFWWGLFIYFRRFLVLGLFSCGFSLVGVVGRVWFCRFIVVFRNFLFILDLGGLGGKLGLFWFLDEVAFVRGVVGEGFLFWILFVLFFRFLIKSFKYRVLKVVINIEKKCWRSWFIKAYFRY